jgi:hypothetical protein
MLHSPEWWFRTDVSGQPIGSAFKGQEIQEERLSSWTSWPLKVGPIGCPETLVWNHHSRLCNIPEERGSHVHRGGSLKSTCRIVSSVINCRAFYEISNEKYWGFEVMIQWIFGTHFMFLQCTIHVSTFSGTKKTANEILCDAIHRISFFFLL